jgi:hypothetical protein
MIVNSVPCEIIFSKIGQIITDRRTNLSAHKGFDDRNGRQTFQQLLKINIVLHSSQCILIFLLIRVYWKSSLEVYCF